MEGRDWFGYLSASERRLSVDADGALAGEFTGIRFRVGLDPETDAADPARWSPDHALHPGVNHLHWGWQGGYVFLALEGRTQAKGGFSYHLARETEPMMVELPVDVQDVIVSHPDTIDATVMAARRIVLIAKSAGEANAFILGRDGRKLMIIDFTEKRDLSDLGAMYKRLLPGSSIALSSSGEGVVLSGRVANPVDAGRAEDMAKQYLKNAPVVNLISASDKEQVLLKVTVAEMQRDAIRRIGVNLPAAIAKAGDFTFAKVIQGGFPVPRMRARASRDN